MTPDEVRMLDNKYALLFIRGELPIKDYKYDILDHPNVIYTPVGKGKPFEHGKTDRSIGTLIAFGESVDGLPEMETEVICELITDKEIELLIAEE